MDNIYFYVCTIFSFALVWTGEGDGGAEESPGGAAAPDVCGLSAPLRDAEPPGCEVHAGPVHEITTESGHSESEHTEETSLNNKLSPGLQLRPRLESNNKPQEYFTSNTKSI